ncbi:alpha/beta hydrolase [Streptomyces sp. NPDC020875]|uniref:alpha/beta fold hydrolase n=1 Tax=Streptomyces sp. NPDC020875 TaxID=3154898 RepID=UPI00340602CF
MTFTETTGLVAAADGARLHWTALGDRERRPAVVLLHGGPGLPDYLAGIAPMIADLAPVYRYDQRGTGRSQWRGHHTLDRHIADLAGLLDAWGVPHAVLIGHSYGADLASRFCLAHPARVAAALLMCGPFTGDWRTGWRAERDRRMSPELRERLRELGDLAHRTEEQEVELLTLSWFPDHADPVRGRHLAAREARRRRPVNWAMNTELGAENRADPLDGHLGELRDRLPARTEILGGADDPRPLASLASLAHRLGVELTAIEGAGHEPWLERPDLVRARLRRFVRDAVGA